MPTETYKFKPGEFCRLLNSTPIGEVITDAQLRRQRTKAGMQVGQGKFIDLIQYTSWLARKRHLKPQHVSTLPKSGESSNQFEAALGIAQMFFPIKNGKSNLKIQRVLAATITEPSHLKAAEKANVSKSTFYRIFRLPEFQRAYGQLGPELMLYQSRRAQAFSGQALDNLMHLSRNAKRESDQIRASNQVLDQSWRGFELAAKKQVLPNQEQTNTVSALELVEILSRHVQQIEVLTLPPDEKARLTVSLCDAIRRAREYAINDVRTKQISDVLNLRKDAP